MKTIRKPLLALAFCLSMLLTSSGVFAQSAPEPAIVVSVAKIKEQLSDINYLMDAAGYGQMAFLVKVQAEQFLKGIDYDRPAGAMLFFEDGKDEPESMAFLPMDNLDDFLTTISEYAEIDEGDKMTSIIPNVGGEEMFLVEDNGFAFVTNNKSLFDAMPSDAEKMLGDLPTRYNVSAKIYGQRVPESLRQQAFDAIRVQSENQLEALEDSDPVQAELRRQNLEMTMERMESLVNDLDILELGFVADGDSESMKFAVKITGLDGSEFARQMNVAGDTGPSKFAGFKMAESAFNAVVRMKIDPKDKKMFEDSIAQAKESVLNDIKEDEGMSDSEQDAVSKIMDKVSEVIIETFEEGELDGGAVLMMEDENANIAGGMRIANPDKLEAAVKDLVAFIEDQEDAAEVFDANLNSGSHNGVRLHTITVNIPEDEEEATKMFGDKVTVLLGIGKKEVFFAAGSDPMALLKKGINSSATPAKVKNHLEYNVFLGPILRFASGIENNEAIELMADKLEEVGKDRMTFSMEIIKNGIAGNFEMKDGVLALIEVAGQAFGGGGFPGEDF